MTMATIDTTTGLPVITPARATEDVRDRVDVLTRALGQAARHVSELQRIGQRGRPIDPQDMELLGRSMLELVGTGSALDDEVARLEVAVDHQQDTMEGRSDAA